MSKKKHSETILPFVKMSGAGNDFIVIDNRDGSYKLSRKAIAALCHRRFGIGADGLLAVEPPRRKGHDFRMRYYNADGGEAEMCGNGARCISRFYHHLVSDCCCAESGKVPRYTFETKAGVIHSEVSCDSVKLGMVEPKDARLNRTVSVAGKKILLHTVNTGVPHVVIFVKNVEKADVIGIGRKIRRHKVFQPAGTNVNFVQVLGKNSIRVRTYERGVEDETLACGTGVTASAIISHLVRGTKTPVRVHTASGRILEVDFSLSGQRFSGVTLAGPADFIFEGEIRID